MPWFQAGRDVQNGLVRFVGRVAAQQQQQCQGALCFVVWAPLLDASAVVKWGGGDTYIYVLMYILQCTVGQWKSKLAAGTRPEWWYGMRQVVLMYLNYDIGTTYLDAGV